MAQAPGSSATPLAVRALAAPLRQQVVERLRAAVIAGDLAPGQRLTERELIDRVGVSRTVIREALRQLESEGLVETVPNKGPVVRALSSAEAADLYRIRAALEALAARLFIERAPAAAKDYLATALAAVEAAYRDGAADGILAAKNRFYAALFDGAGSEVLSSMLGGLHARIWRWRALGLSHPQRSSARSNQAIAGLRELVEAIRRGDAQHAERAIRDDTAAAALEVMRLVENGQPR
ncbi:MAG: GntR family transcriptional regulator [Proteobacteria bacterium]|nr:GntR family transcriptional regulator [Burkholderiales bacterium]